MSEKGRGEGTGNGGKKGQIICRLAPSDEHSLLGEVRPAEDALDL